MNQESTPSIHSQRQIKAKRLKNEFDQVPSNILENEEDDGQREQGVEQEGSYEPEILRCLSPPPNETDYIYGQTRGETLAELFDADVY